MFGEFEDTYESNDAKERQWCTRLCTLAAHCRQNVEQRHVVRYNGHHVDNVLEVFPEVDFGRAGNEPDDRFEGEPGGAGGFDEEERIEEVGRLVLDAVRQRKRRQRLDAEQNYRRQSHDDWQDRDPERSPRRLWVFEQFPESTQMRIARHWHHLQHIIVMSLPSYDPQTHQRSLHQELVQHLTGPRF